MGRKGPGRRTRPPGQSQVEKEAAQVRGTLGVGRVVADESNEEEAWAQKMDEWIVWEAEEEAARIRGI